MLQIYMHYSQASFEHFVHLQIMWGYCSFWNPPHQQTLDKGGLIYQPSSLTISSWSFKQSSLSDSTDTACEELLSIRGRSHDALFDKDASSFSHQAQITLHFKQAQTNLLARIRYLTRLSDSLSSTVIVTLQAVAGKHALVDDSDMGRGSMTYPIHSNNPHSLRGLLPRT